VADILYIFFSPVVRALLNRIHAHADYVELEGVFINLELERRDPSLLGAD